MIWVIQSQEITILQYNWDSIANFVLLPSRGHLNDDIIMDQLLLNVNKICKIW